MAFIFPVKKCTFLQQAVQERNLKAEEVSSGELVEIPEQYKGLVFGKKGKNLKDISTHTGAKLVGKDNGVFIVTGTPEQRVQAKVRIKEKIVSKSVSFNVSIFHTFYQHKE